MRVGTTTIMFLIMNTSINLTEAKNEGDVGHDGGGGTTTIMFLIMNTSIN